MRLFALLLTVLISVPAYAAGPSLDVDLSLDVGGAAVQPWLLGAPDPLGPFRPAARDRQSAGELDVGADVEDSPQYRHLARRGKIFHRLGWPMMFGGMGLWSLTHTTFGSPTMSVPAAAGTALFVTGINFVVKGFQADKEREILDGWRESDGERIHPARTPIPR